MAAVTHHHDLLERCGGGHAVPPWSARDRQARRLAQEVHAGQLDWCGEPMVDHLERIAGRVPVAARPVALVHDVCERSTLQPEDVAAMVGLEEHEREALVLLTRKPGGEGFIDHVQRVTGAPTGPARELALVVKRAAVEDHLLAMLVPETQYRVAWAILESAGDGTATRHH